MYPESYFFLKNGEVIKDLHELIGVLKSLDDDTFKFHVNDEKNDFANWIRNTLMEEDIADEIFESKDKLRMASVIEKALGKKKEKESIFFQKFEDVVLQKFLDKTNFSGKMEEIVNKEKEIEKREAKIQEIEEEIEKRLENRKLGEIKFSIKAFASGALSGLVIGALATFLYVFISNIW